MTFLGEYFVNVGKVDVVMWLFMQGDYLQIAYGQGEGQPLATHLPSYHGYFMGNHVSPGEAKIKTNDKILSSAGGCRRGVFLTFFLTFFFI